jgi:hypothetical protein
MRRALERNHRASWPALMIGANTKRLVLLSRAISTSLANALHANKAHANRKQTWRVDGYRVDADFTGQLPAVGFDGEKYLVAVHMDSGYITLKPPIPQCRRYYSI